MAQKVQLVDPSGNSTTATTAALTSVGANVASVQFLASNTSRKSFSVTNESTTANCYLAYGATASLTAYKVKLTPGAYYEMPASPVWQGAVSGIWDVASGNARISEES